VRTYVDATVLIFAARGTGPVAQRAIELLTDPGREFVASVFLRLELLPKPQFFGRRLEVDFLTTFFDGVVAWAADLHRIVEDAFPLAAQYGLAAMDALHVTAALSLESNEFVTAERATSPLLRVQELPVRTLLEHQVGT